MRAELPNLRIHGACVLCPHMKKSTLASILNVLRAPDAAHTIELPEDVRVRAKKSLDEMFRLTEGK
jgi:quinolinate synthase